ncbi:hypothetical protein EIN_176590 [Entamoeba invadens IP1]|uniref:hypothetical protein n=1 Tax=Entamoeba invadens IP1 TaxID=370355 RepID=UPI0002C3D520|nr:hypothetical protein EIN_176590 [Entamoeba invadens IP1]ELP93832.1 hypothetical protein EIN_176590 [Entamoeba invadens IP1]|eukprot:XP_004260603.1 hypothetical protein EIN_176590 [Entamoeba invadens IP1]
MQEFDELNKGVVRGVVRRKENYFTDAFSKYQDQINALKKNNQHDTFFGIVEEMSHLFAVFLCPRYNADTNKVIETISGYFKKVKETTEDIESNFSEQLRLVSTMNKGFAKVKNRVIYQMKKSKGIANKEDEKNAEESSSESFSSYSSNSNDEDSSFTTSSVSNFTESDNDTESSEPVTKKKTKKAKTTKKTTKKSTKKSTKKTTKKATKKDEQSETETKSEANDKPFFAKEMEEFKKAQDNFDVEEVSTQFEQFKNGVVKLVENKMNDNMLVTEDMNFSKKMVNTSTVSKGRCFGVVGLGKIEKTGNPKEDLQEIVTRITIMQRTKNVSSMPVTFLHMALLENGVKVLPRVLLKDFAELGFPFFGYEEIVKSLREKHDGGIFTFKNLVEFVNPMFIEEEEPYYKTLLSIDLTNLTVADRISLTVQALYLPKEIGEKALAMYQYIVHSCEISSTTEYMIFACVFEALRFTTRGWETMDPNYFLFKYIEKYGRVVSAVQNINVPDVSVVIRTERVKQIGNAMENISIVQKTELKEKVAKKMTKVMRATENWKRRVSGKEEILFGDEDERAETLIGSNTTTVNGSDTDSFKNTENKDAKIEELKKEYGFIVEDIDSKTIGPMMCESVSIEDEQKEKERVTNMMCEWISSDKKSEFKAVKKFAKPVQSPTKEKEDSLDSEIDQMLITPHFDSKVTQLTVKLQETYRFTKEFTDQITANQFKEITTEFGVITVDEQTIACKNVSLFCIDEITRTSRSDTFFFTEFPLTETERVVIDIFSRLLCVDFDTFNDKIKEYICAIDEVILSFHHRVLSKEKLNKRKAKKTK